MSSSGLTRRSIEKDCRVKRDNDIRSMPDNGRLFSVIPALDAGISYSPSVQTIVAFRSASFVTP